MLKDNGHKVFFLHQDSIGNHASYIKGKGYEVKLLKNSQPDTDYKIETIYSVSKQVNDAEQCLKIIKEKYTNNGKLVDWLIVDHYGLDKCWHSRLRNSTKRIMVLDDLANRDCDCDLLIDSNYCKESRYYEYKKNVSTDCKICLGLKYQPIGKEFYRNKLNVVRDKDSCRRVLVYMGGGDASGITELLLSFIIRVNNHDIHTLVLVGEKYSNKNSFYKTVGEHVHIEILEEVESMSEILQDIDLIVCAGGGVLYEAGLMGVPVVTITTAMNQKEQAELLDIDNYIKNLGSSTTLEFNQLEKLYNSLSNNWLEFKDRGEKFSFLFTDSEYSCSKIYNEMSNFNNIN